MQINKPLRINVGKANPYNKTISGGDQSLPPSFRLPKEQLHSEPVMHVTGVNKFREDKMRIEKEKM